MSNDASQMMIELLAEVLEDGPSGEVVLPEEGLERVRFALDATFGDDLALIDALEGLLVAAHVLETEQDAKDVASRLVALAERPVVFRAVDAIEARQEAKKAEAVRRGARRFRLFSGGRSEPKPLAAPAKAKGGLRLDDLAFPRRL